jgi:hypothetical protein
VVFPFRRPRLYRAETRIGIHAAIGIAGILGALVSIVTVYQIRAHAHPALTAIGSSTSIVVVAGNFIVDELATLTRIASIVGAVVSIITI